MNAPLGLAVLCLIGRSESEAPAAARDLVARAKTEIGDPALRAQVIELIETVIIYKLARFSREEIQAMLQVHDLRETRVYQEAKQEGREEGIAHAIRKLSAKKMAAAEIASTLEVDLELVHHVLQSGPLHGLESPAGAPRKPTE